MGSIDDDEASLRLHAGGLDAPSPRRAVTGTLIHMRPVHKDLLGPLKLQFINKPTLYCGVKGMDLYRFGFDL